MRCHPPRVIKKKREGGGIAGKRNDGVGRLQLPSERQRKEEKSTVAISVSTGEKGMEKK